MKESEVWPLATEIWEKRGKIGKIKKLKVYDASTIYQGSPGTYLIFIMYKEGREFYEDKFLFEHEVRRFLDGLE